MTWEKEQHEADADMARANENCAPPCSGITHGHLDGSAVPHTEHASVTIKHKSYGTCGMCSTEKECRSKYNKDYYRRNKSQVRANQHRWRQSNLSLARALSRTGTARLRETQPEKRRASVRAHAKAKPWMYAAKAAARRAVLGKATPWWVDRDSLKSVYKGCPAGMHVDHIVPLNNASVCGLHVPWNLQYLSPEENARKGNKFYA